LNKKKIIIFQIKYVEKENILEKENIYLNIRNNIL